MFRAGNGPPAALARFENEMRAAAGHIVHEAQKIKALPAPHGGALGESVPGFVPVGCDTQHLRAVGAGIPAAHVSTLHASVPDTLQCIYSGGLVTVSLFLDASASQQVARRSALGASYLLAQRFGAHGWLTAMGEGRSRAWCCLSAVSRLRVKAGLSGFSSLTSVWVVGRGTNFPAGFHNDRCHRHVLQWV